MSDPVNAAKTAKEDALVHEHGLRVTWRPPSTTPGGSNTSAIAGAGTFAVEEAATKRESVIGVLHSAAEIEHGILIEYLYAAASLIDPDAAMLVTSVAIEEMGHLLTVQNILLAVGAEPYLGRQDQAPNDPFDPFPFRLEPATLGTIACYVAAESPDSAELSFFENRELNRIRRVADSQIQSESRRKPSGPLLNRVGVLYDHLLKIFTEADADQLCVGLKTNRNRQASKEEAWAHGGEGRAVIVQEIGSLADLVGALHAVAGQGEGFECAENSHFHRFRRLYRGMRRRRWIPDGLAYQSATQPLRRLRWIWRALGVYDPALQSSVTAERIDTEGKQLVRLLSLRYQLALLTSRLVLERGRGEQSRRALIDLLLRDMALILPPLATACSRQVSRDSTARPYELPKGVPAATLAARKAQLRQAIADSAELCSQLRHGTQSYLWNVFQTITECDRQRNQVLGPEHAE